MIELLVVIAIIAVLVSMLLPGLSEAQEAGRRSVCQSNQHQIYIGIPVYAGDYNDRLPGAGGDTVSYATINYNQGHVQGFLREYMGWDAVRNRRPVQCPSSRLAQLTTWPTAANIMDYRLAGCAPFGWDEQQRVHDHPRFDKVGAQGPRGPKVMIQDLLFVGLWTDWRSFVWHYGTGHRPGDPRGGNVTAGDGSTFWLALASRARLPFPGSSGVTFTQDANWFTVDNYLGNSFCVPKAYYSQIAGWGSIELGTAGTSVVGYSPGDTNVFSTVANRGLYY